MGVGFFTANKIQDVMLKFVGTMHVFWQKSGEAAT